MTRRDLIDALEAAGCTDDLEHTSIEQLEEMVRDAVCLGEPCDRCRDLWCCTIAEGEVTVLAAREQDRR